MATSVDANGTSNRTQDMAACEENGGTPLLSHPVLNRGTAFTSEQRRLKRLEGLLPPNVETADTQANRVLWQLNALDKDIEKYKLLQELGATNQRLFYKVLYENIEKLLPIVYTPTVGQGCQNFHRLFMNSGGFYLSAFHHRGRFRELLDHWPSTNVEIIVVTDGGRILGLGDLGTNGMGISIGKIALYVAGAGFDPEKAMPVCLDCGTDNPSLIDDPLYLGERRSRISEEALLDVVREFCNAVKDKWPSCLIQFEDFKTPNAIAILKDVRNDVLCFNDDIQGTAAVVCAGFLNGIKLQGTDLVNVRMVFYGAGSSAIGAATMLADLIKSECRISENQAHDAIYLVDSKGLVTNTRGDDLAPRKKPFARNGVPDMSDLLDIVRYVKPHALIGLAGDGPAFSKEVVEELCHHCDRPLIFPLSNPTSKAEISAEDAYHWSKGKCLFAAGSPFAPVTVDGRTYTPGQANNVFIFPGVGFGSVAVKAKTVTDDMFITAAKALASYVKEGDLKEGRLYPPVRDLRAVSVSVAKAVARKAVDARNVYTTGRFFPAHVIGRIWTYED